MTTPNPTARAAALIASLAAAAALVGCAATPLKPPIAGYTCCNLRVDGEWISSNNVQGPPMIQAGEPATFDSMKKNYYVYGVVGTTTVGLRDDNASSQPDTLRWARTIIVAEDPRPRIAGWPADVRNAVHTGRVIPGMTKEQVLVSLGYPARSDTPDTNAPVWRYWTQLDDAAVDLRFDDAGKLVELTGKASAVRSLTMAN